MQLPALAIRADLLANPRGIEIAREARKERRAIDRQNFLEDVGDLAASGNYLEAAREAMRGGALDTGFNVLKSQQALEDAATERRLKLLDFFGRGAAAADTPEKWQALINMAQQAYGGNADLSSYQDFNTRPQVMQFLGNAKSELEREKTRAEIGRLQAQTQLYQAQAAGGGAKPPAGYRWSPDGFGSLEAIPGGPATKLSSETAGRVAMMQTAQSGLPEARKALEGEWGMGGAFQNLVAQVPYVGDVAWLSGDIGRARRTVRVAIEAALRAMTGAAAPESEVDRYEGMFMPGVNDTAQSARQKLDALDQFVTRAEEIVTRGRRPGSLTGAGKRKVPVPDSILRRSKRANAAAQIPSAAIDYLRQNAGDANVLRQFDEKYGSGSAQRILGGAR